jgi:hypothetical protein
MDYGCDNCPKNKNNHCQVWQVKIIDAHNSSCESGAYWINQLGRIEPKN